MRVADTVMRGTLPGTRDAVTATRVFTTARLGSSGPMTQQHPDLADEQAYIDLAYECLERSRDRRVEAA